MPNHIRGSVVHIPHPKGMYTPLLSLLSRLPPISQYAVTFSTCFHPSQLLYIILQNPSIYCSSVVLPLHSLSIPLSFSFHLSSWGRSRVLARLMSLGSRHICVCVRMKGKRGYKSPKSRSWASCGQVCDDVNLPVLFHFFSSWSLVALWHRTGDLQILQVKHQRC